MACLGWGRDFLDYDNDGALDLFVANGHVYPIVDGFDWNTSYRQRALLFRNVKGKFVEIGGWGGGERYLPQRAPGRGGGGVVKHRGGPPHPDAIVDRAPPAPQRGRGTGAAHALVHESAAPR